MSSSAICSERRALWCRGEVGRGVAAFLLITLAGSGLPGTGWAQNEDPRTAIVAAAYPEADSIWSRTGFLTEAELAQARSLAGADVPIESALVTWFEVWEPAGDTVRVFFDSHRIRTHPQTLLIGVSGGGTVSRLQVMRFDEPPDYRAPEAWSAQLLGRGLDERLRLGAGIRGITGASLTARATVRAVRRVLALDAVLSERSGDGG